MRRRKDVSCDVWRWIQYALSGDTWQRVVVDKLRGHFATFPTQHITYFSRNSGEWIQLYKYVNCAFEEICKSSREIE